MRGIIEGCIVILIATLMLAAMPTDAEARIYEDTIRLHILAESDSSEDQTIKLIIRDRLLEKYGDMLSKCKSKDEAEAAMRGLTDSIRNDVRVWLRELGCEADAEITLTYEQYGRREYGDYTLPSGEYLSLRVIIGKGEGQNWWCVMYPPLCLDVALGDTVGYSSEEKSLIRTEKYNVKLKILEICSEVFKK